MSSLRSHKDLVIKLVTKSAQSITVPKTAKKKQVPEVWQDENINLFENLKWVKKHGNPHLLNI